MSLCQDGASPSGPDGIRDDRLVRWALAWTVFSVLASVLMMALTSRTTPLNACSEKRGAAVDSSTLDSMTSTLGETPVFVLRMAAFSRCASYFHRGGNAGHFASIAGSGSVACWSSAFRRTPGRTPPEGGTPTKKPRSSG